MSAPKAEAAGPCQSVARAILGAVDAPDGVLLRCGLLAGHDGRHRFEMSWSDPVAEVPDNLAAYLNSRRLDPEFQRRIRERMTKDAEILRRLAEDDGPDLPQGNGFGSAPMGSMPPCP